MYSTMPILPSAISPNRFPDQKAGVYPSVLFSQVPSFLSTLKD